MCFDGALRFVVFLACSPCTASASSSCFRGPWPVWSRFFCGLGLIRNLSLLASIFC